MLWISMRKYIVLVGRPSHSKVIWCRIHLQLYFLKFELLSLLKENIMRALMHSLQCLTVFTKFMSKTSHFSLSLISDYKMPGNWSMFFSFLIKSYLDSTDVIFLLVFRLQSILENWCFIKELSDLPGSVL